MLFNIAKQLPLIDGSYIFSLQNFMTLFSKDLTDREENRRGSKNFLKEFCTKLTKRFYNNICMGLF